MLVEVKKYLPQTIAVSMNHADPVHCFESPLHYINIFEQSDMPCDFVYCALHTLATTVGIPVLMDCDLRPSFFLLQLISARRKPAGPARLDKRQSQESLLRSRN